MPTCEQPNNAIPLIDVRPDAAFVAAHVPGSVSIPLEELPARQHELSPASQPVRVIDSDETRSSNAARFLRKRGHAVEIVAWNSSRATETGAVTVHLWTPSPFLVKALRRINAEGSRPSSALDVACGSGRDAVYLALQGCRVEAIDLLPDALQRAQDLARRNGVTITTRLHDLERDPTLPEGRYDLVCVSRYLQRNLFPALGAAVRPGGYIVYETFHERNRDTGLKPRSPDHLLKTGELEAAFEGFDLLIARDAYQREGRFFSCLLARRPG